MIHKDTSEKKDAEITPLEYKIFIQPVDFTLEILYQKWKNGEIIIPKFQRKFVWNIKKSSRLIESIMAGLPIPPVFLSSTDENKHLVIDGKQRLESIFYFMDGLFPSKTKVDKKQKFKLVGFNEKSKLYRKSYAEFDATDKRKLNNYILRATIINQTAPENSNTSIYHIFERLNTGGMELKPQEIRNCIYEGKLNDMLIDINKYPNWRLILGKHNIDNRQKDVEYILRYMSLRHNHKKYQKPINDFLSRFMKNHQNPSNKFLEQEKECFKKTCDRIIKELGKKPFHSKFTINPSLFDSVFVAFAHNLDCHPDDIRKRFCKLLEDKNFQKAISDATTDKVNVDKRLELSQSILFG